MAISRMQQPRQMYGLGSFVKKVTGKVTKPFTKVAKKIVPKEIAGIMRVAAPFLPGGFREAAYLLGTAKQTGRISPLDLALTATPYFLENTQTGQNLTKRFKQTKVGETLFGKPYQYEDFEGPTRFFEGDGGGYFTPQPGYDKIYAEAGYRRNILPKGGSEGILGTGGEMFQFGKDAGPAAFRDQTKLGSLLLGGEKSGTYSKSKILGLGLGTLSLVQSARTPQEAGEALVASTGNPEDYERGVALFSQIPEGAFDIPAQYRLANGGMPRRNYAMAVSHCQKIQLSL